MSEFWNGFEKRSWNLAQARLANKATVAPNLIRRGYAAIPGKSELGVFHKRHAYNPSVIEMGGKSPIYVGPVSIPRGVKRVDKASEGYTQHIDNFTEAARGKILAHGPSTERLTPSMKGIPIPKEHLPPKVTAGWTPEQKEMYNRSVLQHEGDELKYGRKPGAESTAYAGHISPQVLLEDSNRIATMPSEFAPVKEQMIASRADYGLPKDIRGFEFGKTRVSRHARKRLSEIVLNRAADERARIQAAVDAGKIK